MYVFCLFITCISSSLIHRSSLSLTPYLSSLFHTLTQSATLSQLLPLRSSTLHIIQQLTHTILSLLMASICPLEQSAVTLYGAVNDIGERARRPYYSVSSGSSLQWAKKEVTRLQGINSLLMGELMKFLKKLLSLSETLPEIGEQLDKFFNENHTCFNQVNVDHVSDYHVNSNELCFAKSDKPLLNLVLRDKKLLTKLLESLSSTHNNKLYSRINKNGSGSSINNVGIFMLKDFISFLEKNCASFACFYSPLVRLMEVYCTREEMALKEREGERKTTDANVILNLLKKFVIIAASNEIEDEKEIHEENHDSEQSSKDGKKRMEKMREDEKEREESNVLCKDKELFIKNG